MWSLKAGGLTQVNYREKYTFGGLKRRSLNTYGLKDRFYYMIILLVDIDVTVWWNGDTVTWLGNDVTEWWNGDTVIWLVGNGVTEW